MKSLRYSVALFCALVVIMCLALSVPQQFEKFVCHFPQGEISVFCTQTSCKCVDVGLGKIVRCTLEELPCVLQRCSGVGGISVCFDGVADDLALLTERFGVDVIDKQICGDVVVLCGYCPLVCGGVVVDNAKVNLQIAYHNGKITVGSPLILGSY